VTKAGQQGRLRAAVNGLLSMKILRQSGAARRAGFLALGFALLNLSSPSAGWAAMGGLEQSGSATQEAGQSTRAALAAPDDLQRLWRDKPNEGFNHPLVNKKAQHQIVVFGDSLGDGVWAGLYRLFRQDRSVTVIKQSRVATGFARADLFDWNAKLSQILRQHHIDAAVLVFGTNDRQTILQNGRSLRLRTPEWENAYTVRLRDFVAQLKAHGAQVYWLGLPVMRNDGFGEDMRYFNTLFQRVAHEMGVTYIPSWQDFVDAEGRYSDYGADNNGTIRRLRADDGIHMTMNGYVKYAALAAGIIRSRLTQEKPIREELLSARPFDPARFEESSAPNGESAADIASMIATSSAEPAMYSAQDGKVGSGAATSAVPALGLRRQIYEFIPERPGRADDFSWPPR
jgi:hypothetical protein